LSFLDHLLTADAQGFFYRAAIAFFIRPGRPDKISACICGGLRLIEKNL